LILDACFAVQNEAVQPVCQIILAASHNLRPMTLKLKRTPGIYLVGFMAAGKSTIGSALAEQLGWPFVDIDLEIERQEQLTIAQLFTDRGEAAFRDLETAMIRKRVNSIRAGCPSVVALGGGAFVQPKNWELLENNGITIWLDCPFDLVCRRLNGDVTRPLARDLSRLAQIFEDRRPLYSRADFRVEITTEDVCGAVGRILQLPLF
jgi:shikimate kinase